MNGAPVTHNEKHIFQGGVLFLTLPDMFVGTFPTGETLVSVKNLLVFKFMNIGPVTVNGFKDGQSGQTIKILGDGQTTLDHGVMIFNNTGADKLLEANKVYTYTYIGGVWYEDAA